MCGISGYISRGNAKVAQNIIKMNDAIKHRGPDDEGYVCLSENGLQAYSGADSMGIILSKLPRLAPDTASTLALGFRRLSILDLSEKGHQPMLDEQVCITFNGEIYNFKALRTTLESYGHVFNGNSDTEVILKAYKQWGLSMVEKLNGMFAIALVDMQLRKTFLIRDRVGMKPLFYHKSADVVSWSSEIKGILRAEWVKPEMSLDGLMINYQFKASAPPLTCFQHIFSVPPAHILTIHHQDLSIDSLEYWQLPIGKTTDKYALEAFVDALSNKLNTATQLQLQSDVPLITMMSGGIDSTFITALAHQNDPSLSCYTLSIDGTGTGLDELPQAQKMAQQLGIPQLVQHITELDIVENAMHHLSHFEEPYNSLDVIFNAAKFIKDQGFKVILSGNGADELFGGYAHNFRVEKWRKLKPFSFMSGLLPNGDAKLQKLKYFLSLKDIGHFFMSTTGGMRDYLIADLMQNASLSDIKKSTNPFINKNDFDSDYEGMFYYDMKYSLGAHHVYHDDICAMRYSVEFRYPYLDHELIEMVARVPMAYRFNGIQNKPLLRKMAANVIAPDNLQMTKKGFSLPQDAALENNKTLQNFVQHQLQYLYSTGIFNKQALERVIAQDKARHYYAHTWQLVSTAVWMQTYF